jgi:hypothetical protein
MFNTWIVRQDTCPKYNKSNTLLCPAIYCVKQNTVSTLAFNIHLFNFPFWTCCGRIMLRCAYPFIIFVTVLTVKILWSTIFFSRTRKYLIRFLLWCSYWLFFRVRMQNSAQNVFLSMSTNLYSKLFESECIIT